MWRVQLNHKNMEISETQKTLIQNLKGKTRDKNTLKIQQEIKDLEKKITSRGFSKFSSGPAISEEFDIRFKYLKELAHEYMKIYLDVLAPENTLISDELLNYILEKTKENLNGLILGIRQTIDDYKKMNKRFNIDGHLKRKLDEKLIGVVQEIRRDLLIEQDKRNLNATTTSSSEKTLVDRWLRKFKNNRILSIIIIFGIIIIAIGTFTDALRNIFDAIQPYIQRIFPK